MRVTVTCFADEFAKKTDFARETYDLLMYALAVPDLLGTRRKTWVAQKKQYLATSGVAPLEGSLVSP
jgi:hypothetical protein